MCWACDLTVLVLKKHQIKFVSCVCVFVLEWIAYACVRVCVCVFGMLIELSRGKASHINPLFDPYENVSCDIHLFGKRCSRRCKQITERKTSADLDAAELVSVSASLNCPAQTRVASSQELSVFVDTVNNCASIFKLSIRQIALIHSVKE